MRAAIVNEGGTGCHCVSYRYVMRHHAPLLCLFKIPSDSAALRPRGACGAATPASRLVSKIAALRVSSLGTDFPRTPLRPIITRFASGSTYAPPRRLRGGACGAAAPASRLVHE